MARHQFSGKVKGDIIEGTVKIVHEPFEEGFELPWRATRSQTSAYFAPTGLNVK